MGDWSKLDLSQVFPSSLGAGVQGIARLLEAALAEARARSAIGVNVDPALDLGGGAAAAGAAVDAILGTVTELLQGGRVHALIVPIAKTYPGKPPTVIPSTLDGIQHALDVNLGPASPGAALAYAKAVSGTGGNAGFYQAFAESVYDPGDPNRPQYLKQTDAVAMVTVLVGAPTFAGVAAAAATLEYVFAPKTNTGGMTARMIPQPRSLRARAAVTAEGQQVGVRLDWDLPKASYGNEYIPGVQIRVKRYAVIRSTDNAIISARTVKDLFGGAVIVEGLSVGAHAVVAIGTGGNAAYFDDNPPVGKPLYYTVAWEHTIIEGTVVTTHGFDKLGEVVKVVAKTPPPAQTGRSPNWAATTSLAGHIPGFSSSVQALVERAKVLLANKPSTGKKVEKCLALAAGVTERASARTVELVDILGRLGAVLAKPLPGLFVTTMSSKYGGNAYLLSELAKRLCDDTDTSRPRFDNGEYVCGICLVAGAPRFADLATVLALFDLLFGGANAPSSNPLRGLLTAIDTLVTQSEANVFGQSIAPVTPTDGVSVDPLTGLDVPAQTTTFADDGSAIAADDPSNPEAGDTNVQPLKDLC